MGKQAKNNDVSYEFVSPSAALVVKEIFRITSQGEIEVDGTVINDDATLAKLLRELVFEVRNR